MTEEHPNDDLSEAEKAELASFLSEPLLWDVPSVDDENAIVAAILAEAASAPTPAPPVEPTIVPSAVETAVETQVVELTAADELPSNVIPISRARRWLAPVAAGVAAAMVVIAGFVFVTAGDSNPDGVELALAGTDVAPDARADAVITELQSGTQIILDVSGLPPAEPGMYYEAWMRKDAEVGVSAGTFHMRGGDDTIELWSGVTADDYPLITVTLQNEAQTESSGIVVLKGLLSNGDLSD